MVFVPATVLGGLPVIAEVWFSGPDYDGEYDAGVDGLYWRRSDGSRGKPLSEAVMDRVERDNYWHAYVTEQANDWLGEHAPLRRRSTEYPYRWVTEGDWSEEYIALNGRPANPVEPDDWMASAPFETVNKCQETGTAGRQASPTTPIPSTDPELNRRHD